MVSKTDKTRSDRPLSDIGYSTPESYTGIQKFWSDEFSGSAVNTADWTFEIGSGTDGWGNKEAKYTEKKMQR